MPNNIERLYTNLSKDGYKLGTLEDFTKAVGDSAKASRLYKNLSKDGYQLGSFEDFAGKIGAPWRGDGGGKTAARTTSDGGERAGGGTAADAADTPAVGTGLMAAVRDSVGRRRELGDRLSGKAAMTSPQTEEVAGGTVTPAMASPQTGKGGAVASAAPAEKGFMTTVQDGLERIFNPVPAAQMRTPGQVSEEEKPMLISGLPSDERKQVLAQEASRAFDAQLAEQGYDAKTLKQNRGQIEKMRRDYIQEYQERFEKDVQPELSQYRRDIGAALDAEREGMAAMRPEGLSQNYDTTLRPGESLTQYRERMERQKAELGRASVDKQLEDAYKEKERIQALIDKDRGPGGLPAGWGTAMYQAGHGVPIEHDTDRDYYYYNAALRKVEDRIQTLEAEKNDAGFLEGMWGVVSRPKTWSFGIIDLADEMAIGRAVDADGKTDGRTNRDGGAETLLRNAVLANEAEGRYGQNRSAWYRAGQMGGESLAMMPDFILGGGMMKGIATGVAKGVARAAGEKLMKKAAGRLLVKATGYGVGTTLGGAAMVNTVQMGRLGAETMRNYHGELTQNADGSYGFEGGDENFLNALLKAEQTMIPEAASEAVGEFLPGVGKVIGRSGASKIGSRLGLSKIASGLERLQGTKWYKNYDRALRYAGFHGAPGEAIEEYAGDLYSAVLGDLSGIVGDENGKGGWLDGEKHLDIWLGTATLGAVLHAPSMLHTGYAGAQYYRYKHKTDIADRAGRELLGSMTWDSVKSSLDNATNADMAKVLTTILRTGGLSPEGRKAAVDYAGSLQRQRGYSAALMAAAGEDDAEGAGGNPAQPTGAGTGETGAGGAGADILDNSYGAGYEAKGREQKDGIRATLSAAEAALDGLGEGFSSWVKDSFATPMGTLTYMREHRDVYSDEQIAKAADYYQARMQYEGMEQAAADRRDTEGEPRVSYAVVEPDAAYDSGTGTTVAGGFTVSSYDKEGELLGQAHFDSEEEANAFAQEQRMRKQQENLQTLFQQASAQGFNSRQLDAIHRFEAEQGWIPGSIQNLAERDPMTMSEEEHQMADAARAFMFDLVHPSGTLHSDESREQGVDAAEDAGIDTDMPNAEIVSTVVAPFVDARQKRDALFSQNEELAEEVQLYEQMGKSEQEIISLISSFSSKDVRTVIDFYNARAKFEGFMQRSQEKIDERVRMERSRRTFKGTINGQPDQQNLVEVSDGENTYTLLNGNVNIDGQGRVTGSDSGMILALDQNGEIVQLGEDASLTVLPRETTLDMWEQAFLEEEQVKATSVIDPTGALNPSEGVGTGTDVPGTAAGVQTRAGQDNAGGEAGADGTGGNEPPAPAPSAGPTPPANPPSPAGDAAGTPAVSIESVTDKDGIKRYENGVSAEDAIADIHADGLDVDEVADASISEAQAVIDKINGKTTKTRKDLVDRKKAQDVIDYYQALKERWGAMVSRATEEEGAKGEENVNNEDGQPVSEGNIVPSQAGSEAGANAPGTATMAVQGAGRRQLNAEEQKQERIKALKAELGDLFDDDFTKADDVYELVSMWVGRKRNLAWDDVNGKRGLQKELGWTRKIGGDTKYIETLLAKKGEGMGVDEFVHMVWESPENTVNGEKRWDDTEIKHALLELLQSAKSKSDVVDYALNSRERAARATMEAQQQMEQEATEDDAAVAVAPLTDEEMAGIEASLPFATPTGEDIPDNPLSALWQVINEASQDGGMPAIRMVDTSQISDGDWIDLASQVYGGAFVDSETVETVRSYAMETGVVYDEVNSTLNIFSGAVTPETLREKLEQFKTEYNGRERETETDRSGEPLRDSNLEPTEAETPQGEGGARPTEAGAAGTEGQGSAEPGDGVVPKGKPSGTVDPYLQPRNEKERQIIADVEAQLQQEIAAAVKARDKAANDLRRAQERESERATDMFSDDEAFQEDGQLFSFDDMGGTDRTADGVERRTAAERRSLQDAQKRVDELQSAAERNSRVRGALDNVRRQTSFEAEGDASGTVAGQPQSREEYLASHPLTEEQIMADEEATEDEKLNAIDFLRGEDDSAISRFYYDGIYERAQKTSSSERRQKKEEKTEKNSVDKPFASLAEVKKFMDEIGYKGSLSMVMTDNNGKKFVRYQASGNITPNIVFGETTRRDVYQQFHNYRNVMDVDIPSNVEAEFERADASLKETRDALYASDRDEIKQILTEAGIPFADVVDSERGSRIVFTDKKNENGNYTDWMDVSDPEQAREDIALIKAKAERYKSDPMAAIEDAARLFRGEQKSKDQQDIDDALKEFNDFLDNAKGSNVLDKFMRKGLEGNDKAQASLLDAFTLTNEAQRMFLKDLLRLASKVGYAYIKSGVHDLQAWSGKMADGIGRKLKEVLGWEDDIIGEFVDEVWQQKYTADGQRMRMSEHAERLKNGSKDTETQPYTSFREFVNDSGVNVTDDVVKEKLQKFADAKRTKFGFEKSDSPLGYTAEVTNIEDAIFPGEEALLKQWRNETATWVDEEHQCVYSITYKPSPYIGRKDNLIIRKEYLTNEKPNNSKVAANSVNVNKEENNEAENVVYLQGGTSQGKPASALTGDSAEFAERQAKMDVLTQSIHHALGGAVYNENVVLKTMRDVKAMAKECGLEDMSATDLQELVETEIVNIAREIASDEGYKSNQQRFDAIVKLYQTQPTLSARDNDRINKQQYSTPAPMAYLMGMFLTAGKPLSANSRGLEPSAGNGMLTIGLPKEVMHVNDIDEMRLSNLAKQGFAEVTSQDGTQSFGEKQYDVIVTNPPFGNVTPKTYDGLYEISGLEHQMAINALESMKDDGRAAIIIGGNTEYNANGTIKGKDRVFLNYLYAHYNVVDVINMDGKTLYSRQGTGFPVRMILINGRKEYNPKDFAPVQSKARAEQVKSYDELYKRVNDDILSDSNKPAGVHDTESGEGDGKHDSGHAGTATETGVRVVRPEGGSKQRELLDSGGQPVSGGIGSTDQGAGAEGDTELGGGSDVVHGAGSAASQPGGSTPAPSWRGGATNGRDNAERPDGRVDVSVGGGQRGSGASQQTEQPVIPAGKPQDTVQPTVKRGLGTEKVPYRKQSGNPFTLQSLMPAEQADVVKKALEELGDVDQFLVDELGYSSKEELHQALAAEQIDSVAMAIHQMNQGNAFIIGDQTGIGKGRQAAALIRYGVKKGGFPVFITVKKGLFSDMYRDLCDIGSPGLRPFIWSADDAQHSANVTDKDGNVVHERPNDKEQKRVIEYINKYGKLPPEYDYVLTTYDSFKSGLMDYENGNKSPRNFGKKQPGAVHRNGQAKRDALERLSENSYVIMDESHNAGGEGSNVSGYLQYITTKAKGLTFLSATFAKRPGNMPIYSLKTAIAKAGVKIDELIDAVKRGGATFQEIMSKALTEAGQMIRRERDMTGVTIDWKGIEDEEVIQKQREQYDTIIGLFNDIIDFQRTYVDPIVNNMNDEAADVQGAVDHTPGTRDMGINNTPFASRTYNMVQQVLLSLKAEETAKRAIEHLKAGHKPVIALANTNEGAADEAAGSAMTSRATEEGMEMPDLSVNLKKGLHGTLRITKKDAFGNSVASNIPFDSLSPEGQSRYREIMDAIDSASSGLSLSPIDVIKNELKKAGYKVGELTGRQQEFVYNADGTVKRVKRQDSDKKKVAADFNNGKLDALILNRSAGTGISLHASSKFDDQRQRVMIVAQAQGDVNDEVQIRGRIDRTGQVLRGMYEYVVSQIPSEQRLLMMLKAKLRSLDANTTSSQKSKFNEMQVQDIINKYGDDIVIQYLAEHPDLAAKMCDPLKWGQSLGNDFETLPAETLVSKAEKPTNGGDGATASKVLGRMALLTVKEQEKMLAEIGELYQAEIDRLNEMGENDLEITEMPLRAKTLKKDVWEEGVEPGGKNPFADNSYVETVEMDVLKKPMKGEEVKKSQARLLSTAMPSRAKEEGAQPTWEDYKRGVMEKLEAWEAEKKKDATATITARAEKKAQTEKEKYARGAKKAQEKNGMTDAEIEKNAQYQYDSFYKQEMDKLQAALDGIDKQKQAFVDALETFTTDGVYALPTEIYDLGQLSFEPSFGKVIDIKIADNFSTTASSISFATLDGRRKITIPISGMVKQSNGEKRDIKPVINTLTSQARHGMFGSNVSNTLKVLEQNVDNWDRLTSTATRKKGYIITGNLLKALTSLREQHLGGKLISYTTDTGEIRQGILMSDQFDPKGLTSKTPISSAKADLDDYFKGRAIKSADGDVMIKTDGYGSWTSYRLRVPKSKKRGEKYFNDAVLLDLMDGQFEGSSNMTADFKAENLDAVLKRLDELGVTVENRKEDADNADTDRRYDEDIDDGEPQKNGERRVEEVKSIIDDLAKRYHGVSYDVISLKDIGGRELLELLFPDDMEGATEEEIAEGIVNVHKFLKNVKGVINRGTGKIVIFADRLAVGEEENVFFHENIHFILERWYGKGSRGIADRFWSSTPEKIGKRTKRFVEKSYRHQSEVLIHDEWLTYNLADAMASGDFSAIDKYITDAADSERINNILNELGYDRRREERERTSQRHEEASVRSDKGILRERKAHSGVLSAHQQRIAAHVEQLVDKLGTKSKTTVYHSLDEVPADVRRHIEERHRQGKKVRGWYENGRVFLFLPDIGSVYEAEKTIWHETVAHHGLRELVGADNYKKLLRQLWLEHRDGDMGKWVTERMQLNGWKLDEAIDEYLAREAEKEPFKEPSLWQRLRWMVADLLHKLGFRSDPTLTDIKYLFWVSQNRLSEGDAMSEIKRSAFLHRLERATMQAGKPLAANYVNMYAERVEDIYNPDAEGAYDDGTRYSEETDEEVIERLEKEPKIKVYRAMSLIDGKLYPPMATKQDGKLRNPIELGKWEKADEHPEKAVKKNGKWVFKLTKDNGKSLFAAYNPYIHTSTTMLNDQFSEAQSRPNLVVVEVEVPESELSSGYKAEKAKDAVGRLEWKAGIIQGQLTGTREVILSRWDKPVRIVPTEEVAKSIANQIKGKVEVMPTNVVTPAQREALEKEGVKFVETDNRGKILNGENAGKTYSSVYGKKSERRFDEDIDNPLEHSAKALYDERLNKVETVFTEAYQDAMVSLKTAQNAIVKDEAIPDSQNAYMAENLMHGKNKNEMDLFNMMLRDPLIETINKIMNATGMNWGDIDRYVYTKSGLERNREFFVRDWLERQRKRQPRSYDDLNADEKALYDQKAGVIELLFEDGTIASEEEKEQELAKALQEAHKEYVDSIENQWSLLKVKSYFDLSAKDIDFADYLAGLTNFIIKNIDSKYEPSEHDYSGFRAMFGDEDGKYDEEEVIDELMDTESMMDADGQTVSSELWERIVACTRYGLERYRESGMRSDEQIDRVEGMFHWYVPMRGFKESTGEDMYQYFTGKENAKSYVGGLLKHAKGRGSEANFPISTIFAMTYKAISDCNQNLVNQKLYRLCQAHPNDLIVLSDSWAVLNEQTGEWEEAVPEIGDDMSEEEIREAVLQFEEYMRQMASAGKAKKITGKAKLDYKPADKKKQSEHVVEVRINGQVKRMTVVGNPRMAQALNGQLRFERGKNIFSKWNAAIKNKMAAFFTSYSPTFAMRNMFRDWTHFRTMLGVREGHGYAQQAHKYYRQSLFKMVGLFRKYREGTLDMGNEMERDFKDFMDNGGITGFVQMRKVEDIQKQMETLYKQQKAGKPVRLNNKVWEYTLGAIECFNEGIENNARFATFRASRHYAGRTRARSAYDAKEITVNFNRRGAGAKTAGFKSRPAGKATGTTAVEDAAKVFGVTSQVLGEGRIFFNATVQAIATTFKNFQNADGSLNWKYIMRWARLYALPSFMFGLASPMINGALRAVLGGDDDDPYANLPEWTRRKNLCLYVGGDNFITIPIGQELSAFLTLGDIIACNTYAPQLKPVDRSLDDELLDVMNTFSPVDLSTKITQGSAFESPISWVAGHTFSVLAPLVAVGENLSWTGRPIYREDKFQNDQYTPEYQMVYQNTNPVLVSASKLLHELGGGDDITRGKLEVNPGIVQYLWEQYTGGPGKVLSGVVSLGKDVKDLFVDGIASDFNVRKIEGLKAFVQQGDDRTKYYRTQAKYFKYKKDADELYHDVQGYIRGAGENPEYVLKLDEISKGTDFVRMQIVRDSEKLLSQFNKAANKAEGAERKELRRLYNERMKDVVKMLDDVGE